MNVRFSEYADDVCKRRLSLAIDSQKIWWVFQKKLSRSAKDLVLIADMLTIVSQSYVTNQSVTDFNDLELDVKLAQKL